MSRGWLRRLGRGAIAVLLFAQLAVAAYACPGLTTAPALSAPAAAHGPECDDPSGAKDPVAKNLCTEHCRADTQSPLTPVLNVPPVLLNMRYAMPQTPAAADPPRATAAPLSDLVAGRPPHAILHCVRRT